MPKYLLEANYLGEGMKGLLKEGGTRRRSAVDDLFSSLGGTVEAFYYAFGERDAYIIGDLPDNAAAAALVMRVNAAGVTSCKTVVLMTTQEIDDAVQRSSKYRPPGFEVEPAALAKWEGEGGNIVPDAGAGKDR